MRKLASVVLIISALLLAAGTVRVTSIVAQEHGGDVKSQNTTNWLGHVAFGRTVVNLSSLPSVYNQLLFSDDYEIGLRSDGVVVWRKP
jgi:hypothetical protein